MMQGFSLTEVLVSLALMTSSSVLLFNHQYQTSQFLTQLYIRLDALSQTDNISERLQVSNRE